MVLLLRVMRVRVVARHVSRRGCLMCVSQR